MRQKLQIKCGNIDQGVYLLDDIVERLNDRLLAGSIVTIKSASIKNHTWIEIICDYDQDFPETIIKDSNAYIKGMVVGILLWSGVEVI